MRDVLVEFQIWWKREGEEYARGKLRDLAAAAWANGRYRSDYSDAASAVGIDSEPVGPEPECNFCGGTHVEADCPGYLSRLNAQVFRAYTGLNPFFIDNSEVSGWFLVSFAESIVRITDFVHSDTNARLLIKDICARGLEDRFIARIYDAIGRIPGETHIAGISGTGLPAMALLDIDPSVICTAYVAAIESLEIADVWGALPPISNSDW